MARTRRKLPVRRPLQDKKLGFAKRNTLKARELALKKGQRACQCVDCPRPAAAESPFCATHTRGGCPAGSPLSGYEPPYEPELWNTDKSIQYSHNCFAYATNYIDWQKVETCRTTEGCNVGFHVPGLEKGHPKFGAKVKRAANYMTCSDVVARTKASLRGVEVGFTDACPPMMSKIAIVVDDKNDLHYYRQDSNGWWSHKPGGRPVTNLDAAGVRIYNPERCSRYYPKEDPDDTGLNYKHFCCFLAIPRGTAAAFIKLAGGSKKRNKKRGTHKK